MRPIGTRFPIAHPVVLGPPPSQKKETTANEEDEDEDLGSVETEAARANRDVTRASFNGAGRPAAGRRRSRCRT